MDNSEVTSSIKIELKNYSDNAVENGLIKPIENLIEFEITRQKPTYHEFKENIDKSLKEVESLLNNVNRDFANSSSTIDLLTSDANNLDYSIAAGSGILTGLIDSFFVGEFSLERGKAWSNDKTNNFVKKIARKTGYDGDDLSGAVKHLEKYGIPSDSVTADFGGGRQHHLRDFAHHPNPIGLIFSIITQFTGNAYGTNTAGIFTIVPIENKTFIGKDFATKISFGVINWFFHMVSDIAGSSGYAGFGTGLPGPILSLAKVMSSVPLFKNNDSVNEIRKDISKLFNGTKLAKRDENGRIIKGANGKAQIERFDFRTELGVLYELGRQAIPVIINEVVVRSFYFISRLKFQLDECECVKEIEWKHTLPFKNRTISRMLTISTGVFTTVDLIDAAIRSVAKSGGLNAATLGNFILKINFIGVGRFAIALGTDAYSGLKKGKEIDKRISIVNNRIDLLVSRVYYKEASMWIEAECTEAAIEHLVKELDAFNEFMKDSWKELIVSSKNNCELIGKLDCKTKEELLNILK